ncbi:MAG TPA: Dabb family protein [Ktedonobacterales bacterium]|nr:Dabb family protein [Ktedonobacterales bacterium]
MIRHEVILRVKQGARREAVERALREVYDLLRTIPGVEQVRFGINAAPAYRHAMLVVDLPDEDALVRFGRHPQHARAIQMLTRLAESTAVGSYLVGSEHRG